MSLIKKDWDYIKSLTVGKAITDVYFQFEEEILGGPCFISTNELYRLVLERKEIEAKIHRGKDIFPVILEDWTMLYPLWRKSALLRKSQLLY